jgi:hypothetical protein
MPWSSALALAQQQLASSPQARGSNQELSQTGYGPSTSCSANCSPALPRVRAARPALVSAQAGSGAVTAAVLRTSFPLASAAAALLRLASSGFVWLRLLRFGILHFGNIRLRPVSLTARDIQAPCAHCTHADWTNPASTNPFSVWEPLGSAAVRPLAALPPCLCRRRKSPSFEMAGSGASR